MSKDEMSSESVERWEFAMKNSQVLKLWSYVCFTVAITSNIIPVFWSLDKQPLIVRLLITIVGIVLYYASEKEKIEEDHKEYLSTPLKTTVLIRKALGGDWLATVYVNRRTGLLSAPTDPKERWLSVAPSPNIGKTTLGAPYWQVKSGTLWMLGAPYEKSC